MTEKDFADMIRIARRAPLDNMTEAEYVSDLLKRFAIHAKEWLELESMQCEAEENATVTKLQTD